jgi:hypothetical protein
MKRTKLRNIISKACEIAEINEADTKRLVATADEINFIAVGTYQTQDPTGKVCGCPATVAGFYDPANALDREEDGWSPSASEEVKTFPSVFDSFVDDELPRQSKQWLCDRHVVKVED